MYADSTWGGCTHAVPLPAGKTVFFSSAHIDRKQEVKNGPLNMKVPFWCKKTRNLLIIFTETDATEVRLPIGLFSDEKECVECLVTTNCSFTNWSASNLSLKHSQKRFRECKNHEGLPLSLCLFLRRKAELKLALFSEQPCYPALLCLLPSNMSETSTQGK